MTLYVLAPVGPGGAAGAPTAVTATDTISGNDIGGAILEVKTGATPTNVTFTDPGKTPYGSGAAAATPIAVGATTTMRFKIPTALVNPVTNLVTVNYSSVVNVTAELYRPV